ncbi:MAG: hypothetical protein ACOCXX_02215 [Planctomycetota bacterium]
MEQRRKSWTMNVIFVAVAVAATLWMARGCQQPPVAMGQWYTVGQDNFALVIKWTGKTLMLELQQPTLDPVVLLKGDRDMRPGVLAGDGSPLVATFRLDENRRPVDVDVRTVDGDPYESFEADDVTALLAVTGEDILAARVFDPETRTLSELVVLDPEGKVRREIDTPAFRHAWVNPAGDTLLLVGCKDEVSQVLDYTTGTLRHELKFPAVLPSPDGTVYVAGKPDDKTITVFKGEEQLGSFVLEHGPLGSSGGLRFSPDSAWFVVVDGQTIRLFRVAPYGQVATMQVPEGQIVRQNGVQVLPGGKTVMLNAEGGNPGAPVTLGVYTPEGKPVWQKSWSGPPEGILPGVFMGPSADGSGILLYLHQDILLPDTKTGKTIEQPTPRNTDTTKDDQAG